MIEIISATRLTRTEFFHTSALGISLRRLAFDPRIKSNIAFENTDGLPSVYNRAIAASEQNAILVFVHDDVWIDDYFICQRLYKAVKKYNIVGVAGNKRLADGQSGWAFLGPERKHDQPTNFSGFVAHGKNPFGTVSPFGHTPASCELLDGLFLAAQRAVLIQKQVEFDPRFKFHFYDMDFCRTARQKGLTLGTWPICLTHQSGGNFASTDWDEAYRIYRKKWDA